MKNCRSVRVLQFMSICCVAVCFLFPRNLCNLRKVVIALKTEDVLKFDEKRLVRYRRGVPKIILWYYSRNHGAAVSIEFHIYSITLLQSRFLNLIANKYVNVNPLFHYLNCVGMWIEFLLPSFSNSLDQNNRFQKKSMQAKFLWFTSQNSRSYPLSFRWAQHILSYLKFSHIRGKVALAVCEFLWTVYIWDYTILVSQPLS